MNQYEREILKMVNIGWYDIDHILDEIQNKENKPFGRSKEEKEDAERVEARP